MLSPSLTRWFARRFAERGRSYSDEYCLRVSAPNTGDNKLNARLRFTPTVSRVERQMSPSPFGSRPDIVPKHAATYQGTLNQGVPMTYVSADPYAWPYDGDLKPDNTALVVIDMQT